VTVRRRGPASTSFTTLRLSMLLSSPCRNRRARLASRTVRLRYELLGCALHGHALVGTDAATVRTQDAQLVREDADGLRWHRCLRCDAWEPRAAPTTPTRETAPDPDEIDVPLRGRPLRDRYVLRLIALDRALHVVGLGLLGTAVLLFAAYRASWGPIVGQIVGILSDLIGDLTSSPAPVEIRLFSEDAAALHATAARVERSIQKVSGVVDTFNGVVVSGPAITFQVDPERAARLGVSATDVANAVTTAMTGDAASSILQQGRLITVRVIFPPSESLSLDTLRSLQVRSAATGGQFRLDQVAEVAYDTGQTEIERDGLRQSVAVTARLSGSDLGTAIRQIRTRLAKDVKLPPGMTVEYGGLYAEQQASFRELLQSLLLAIALVFLVLLIEFRSFAHPVAIVAGAVLALSGVFAGLFVTGSTLNVVSMMGMIMVVGIVAKNGILMLDAVEDHRALGDSLHEALMFSGRRRFRPVLMTSLAAILGMLPLALALGSGAELLQPLAIAVIGGLAVALLFSLVVTPTVYAMLSKDRPGRENTRPAVAAVGSPP